MFFPLENPNDNPSSSSSSRRTTQSEGSQARFDSGSSASGEPASSNAASQSSWESSTATEDAVNAGAARSERARNAANQRHSKAKPTSGPNGGSNKITKGLEHREAVREKNRVAATRCRWKKKLSETDLETRYRAVARANDRMKHELLQLRDELTHCRTLALDHLTGHGGCECDDIQEYNRHQAHITALGVQCQSAYGLGPQLQQRGSLTETRGSWSVDKSPESALALQ